MTYSRENITQKLFPVNDGFLQSLKYDWFHGDHDIVSSEEFIYNADKWFKSSKLNTLHNWSQFTCIDVVLGCTHLIESIILKYGWDGFQILPDEYAYYRLMGKHGTEFGELEPNKPLLISIPNWKYADNRPYWNELLHECESKNIDIHIDFAWITVCRDLEIDLGHPCIKSFAMSLSKYSMEWNRIGLRWSRQRTMDSITIFNHFYRGVNGSLISCGSFLIDKLPRDYGWDTYNNKYQDICANLELTPTKLLHVAIDPEKNIPVGIGKLLGS